LPANLNVSELAGLNNHLGTASRKACSTNFFNKDTLSLKFEKDSYLFEMETYDFFSVCQANDVRRYGCVRFVTDYVLSCEDRLSKPCDLNPGLASGVQEQRAVAQNLRSTLQVQGLSEGTQKELEARLHQCTQQIRAADEERHRAVSGRVASYLQAIKMHQHMHLFKSDMLSEHSSELANALLCGQLDQGRSLADVKKLIRMCMPVDFSWIFELDLSPNQLQLPTDAPVIKSKDVDGAISWIRKKFNSKLREFCGERLSESPALGTSKFVFEWLYAAKLEYSELLGHPCAFVRGDSVSVDRLGGRVRAKFLFAEGPILSNETNIVEVGLQDGRFEVVQYSRDKIYDLGGLILCYKDGSKDLVTPQNSLLCSSFWEIDHIVAVYHIRDDISLDGDEYHEDF
jgi:hypothetical protein